MGRKESNQANKQSILKGEMYIFFPKKKMTNKNMCTYPT